MQSDSRFASIQMLCITHLRRLRHDALWSWKTTRAFFNVHRYPILISLAAVLLIAVVALHPFDRTILNAIQEQASPETGHLASELGRWGDFLCFNLLGVLVVWSGAVLGRARWIQRVAVSALMAAVLSGVACNVFRLSLGRARPKAPVEDRFYGFPGVIKGWQYHSFPSGHTTTAVAGASTIGIAIGPLGAGVVALSASVAWARMYKKQHYPTDVLVGAWMGGLYGLATGWRLRRIRLRLDRMKRAKLRERRREQMEVKTQAMATPLAGISTP
jgi:membrane-associated phospholipid phosphatase